MGGWGPPCAFAQTLLVSGGGLGGAVGISQVHGGDWAGLSRCFQVSICGPSSGREVTAPLQGPEGSSGDLAWHPVLHGAGSRSPVSVKWKACWEAECPRFVTERIATLSGSR